MIVLKGLDNAGPEAVRFFGVSTCAANRRAAGEYPMRDVPRLRSERRVLP